MKEGRGIHNMLMPEIKLGHSAPTLVCVDESSNHRVGRWATPRHEIARGSGLARSPGRWHFFGTGFCRIDQLVLTQAFEGEGHLFARGFGQPSHVAAV